jgi:hypothetical protein
MKTLKRDYKQPAPERVSSQPINNPIFNYLGTVVHWYA